MSGDSEEERVLAFMKERQEGASYFAVTTELGMARTRTVSILEQLHRDGKLTFDCKTKLYFLAPERDRLSAYERKLDAGEITAPDPKLDRASPDRFPPEERPSNKCRYCGEVKEKYLWQHENYCKENPDHKTPPGVTIKTARAEPETIPCPMEGCRSMLRKNRKAIYQHLYGSTHRLPLPEVHAHLDKMLGADRQRTHQSGPSTPAEEKVPEIPPSTPGSERQVTEEPETSRSLLESVVNDPYPKDPAPIDDTVPPLSKEQPWPCEMFGGYAAPLAKDNPESEHYEHLAGVSNSVQPCEINSTSGQGIEHTSSLSKDVQATVTCPTPTRTADPLALFAQQHRLRINKEIRKLRKVEGKLRRRAAAAEAMADRVHAARRTKERELRRFERELAEVSS